MAEPGEICTKGEVSASDDLKRVSTSLAHHWESTCIAHTAILMTDLGIKKILN